MATLDPRVLPLIETLSLAGADWLGFELLEALRRGLETEESEDNLAQARATVRAHQGGVNPSRSLEVPPTSNVPLVGDAQIKWAGAFVVERLEAALAYLSASHTSLDYIADREPRAQMKSDARQALKLAAGSLKLLSSDQPDRAMTGTDLEAAQATLPALEKAVMIWVDETLRTKLA